MRTWVCLRFALVGLLLVVGGCATTEDPYAIMQGFAPNTPRPFPNPRPKPEAPAYAQSKPAVRTASSAGDATVRRGDTVYALARRYARTPREIIDANALKPPYTLYPGQKLKLSTPRYHVVRQGETSYGISRHYNVELTELIRSNHISRPYTLTVGQKLIIPSSGGAAAASAPTQRLAVVPPPPKRSSSHFAWPVEGRVISRFGPKRGGQHNDGINIAAPRGTPVRAAENGVVAYAGSDLKGFGNLLLIRHSGGWVTAYCHNDTLLVKRGDTVRRGQTIARVGSSGSVDSAQLHFEIRRGAKAVNPESYL